MKFFYFKGLVMLVFIQISKILANIKLDETIVHAKPIKDRSKNVSRNLSHRVPLGVTKQKQSLKK
jgi:hypothetical protein